MNRLVAGRRVAGSITRGLADNWGTVGRST